MMLLSQTVVERDLFNCEMSILFILGNVGNAFVILLIRRYRRNPSATYLLIAALMNIFFLTLTIPFYIRMSYDDAQTIHSLIFCKLRFYLSHLLGHIARCLMVLASIDRYLAKNRHFNRSLFAQRSILLLMLLWLILDIYQLFFTTIAENSCGQFGRYFLISSICSLISFSLLPPVLMSVFGYLAYRQLRLVRIRIGSELTRAHPSLFDRKDRTLFMMILGEIFVYLLTMLLDVPINLTILLTFNDENPTPVERAETENFIFLFSAFLSCLNYATPFYIYICVSKGFRREWKKSLQKIFCQSNHTTMMEER